jgi:hypothetical protein
MGRRRHGLLHAVRDGGPPSGGEAKLGYCGPEKTTIGAVASASVQHRGGLEL